MLIQSVSGMIELLRPKRIVVSENHRYQVASALIAYYYVFSCHYAMKVISLQIEQKKLYAHE